MLSFKHPTMVLILDGNSVMNAHVRSNLYCLICLRHLIKSRAVTNQFFFNPKRPIFLYACAIFSELLSNICTMHPTRKWKLD